MATTRILENKIKIKRRVSFRKTSVMLLLSLFGILFSVVVDANRLGHSLHHARLLQHIAENTIQPSGYQSLNNISRSNVDLGSDRGIVDDEDISSARNNYQGNNALLDAKEKKFDRNDSVINLSEAAPGSSIVEKTPGESERTTQGQQYPFNPSKDTTNKKGTSADTSKSSNHSFAASSAKGNNVIELEVEDIPTIVREGTSPMEIFQGSRGMFFCILFGVLVTIFTAWQVADYPDGAYSSLCRWTVTTLGFLFRVLLFPFSICCKLNNHEHAPLPASDYGYKDPSLEFS